jgi:hypothetical protein
MIDNTIEEELKTIGGKQFITSGFNMPCRQVRLTLTRETLASELVVASAGPLAEYALMTPEEREEHTLWMADDLRLSNCLLAHEYLNLTAEEKAAAMQRMYVDASDFVNTHKHSIEAVAEALLERTRLSGEEVAAIVRSTQQGEQAA